jgi:hypothetical protein
MWKNLPAKTFNVIGLAVPILKEMLESLDQATTSVEIRPAAKTLTVFH